MTPIEKLAIAVAKMREKPQPVCHFLSAIHLVAINECEPSPALDAVVEQVEKMLTQCRALCCEYDNLRALTARLEREQGVKVPRFWCGEINTTGEPKKCWQCETLKPPAKMMGDVPETLSRGTEMRQEKPICNDDKGDHQGQRRDRSQSKGKSLNGKMAPDGPRNGTVGMVGANASQQKGSGNGGDEQMGGENNRQQAGLHDMAPFNSRLET